jgi:phosphatidylinositol glycan class V
MHVRCYGGAGLCMAPISSIHGVLHRRWRIGWSAVVQQECPEYILLGTEPLLVSLTSCVSAIYLTFIRDVGLFHYWTVPNIPLFLLAAPMLWLLLASSVTVLRSYFRPPSRWRSVLQVGVTTDPKNDASIMHYVPELALPQLVLAVAAMTSFHVQIVNRLASGYPTWYMMVATWLVDQQEVCGSKVSHRRSQWVIRGMLVYALSQGILFANFLPPA